MPIEIRELHIKVTVPPADNSGAAAEGDPLLLFGDPVPEARAGKDAGWDETALVDRADPARIERPEDLSLRHPSDDAAAQGDGSMHVIDGWDLLS